MDIGRGKPYIVYLFLQEISFHFSTETSLKGYNLIGEAILSTYIDFNNFLFIAGFAWDYPSSNVYGGWLCRKQGSICYALVGNYLGHRFCQTMDCFPKEEVLFGCSTR